VLPLVNDQVYHLFNRSINREPIFKRRRNCLRALTSIEFYRFKNPPARLSYFLSWGQDRRKELIDNLEKENKRKVDILAYCLMPNHYHFLLKQLTKDGIRHFLSLFQNSYTRYFNTRHKRTGPIFQGIFKAIRIETDEQLIHLSRYIHLNPYSSYVVETIKELKAYPWSSLLEYLGKADGFCQKELVFSLFDNYSKRYQKFVFDQADYQRNLEEIKHLTWEKR